jgi:HAMP domain-containing protein
MNLYSYLPLTALFANLFLCFYLIYINPKNKLNQLYGLVTFSLAVWSFSNFYMFNSSSTTQALFWNSFGTLGVVFTSIFLFQFTVFFCDIKRLKNKFFLVFLYILGSILVFTQFSTDLFTKEMQPSYWGYVEVPGMLYPVLSLFVILFVVLSIGICYSFYKKTPSDKNKKQAKYVIIAFLIPLIGGFLSQVIPFYINLEIIPLTSTLTTFTALIIAYAVFKFKLLKPVRFSIQRKIIAGFLLVILISNVSGYFIISSSRSAFEETIGENSVLVVREGIDAVDRIIYRRFERWESYIDSDPELFEFLSASNEEFENFTDILGYIVEKDKNWTSVGTDEITSFMQEIINNKQSDELRLRINFYEEKYGYDLFPEVFITNKYGANVAQTGKTSDYYQADEDWWQKTKNEGFYVTDVEYDNSSDFYSLAICISINDKQGNLSGVIKIIYNIQEIFDVIDEIDVNKLKAVENQNAIHFEFKLLNSDGKIIYSKGQYIIFENISKDHVSRFKEGNESYYIIGGELFSHAISNGYKEYKGNGWILLMEYKTEEIFAPITALFLTLMPIIIFTTIIALLLSIFISRSTSKPIIKLKDAAQRIGQGSLDTSIDINSNDEIGDLAKSFTQMATNLKKYNEKLETEVEKRTDELQNKIEALEKFKKVTVGRELKMAELKKEIKRLESNKNIGGKNLDA